MINLIKMGIQILSEELTRYEQLHVNAENEHQAMSCGAFSSQFLARIKRSNHETDKKNEINKKLNINNVRDECDETQ